MSFEKKTFVLECPKKIFRSRYSFVVFKACTTSCFIYMKSSHGEFKNAPRKRFPTTFTLNAFYPFFQVRHCRRRSSSIRKNHRTSTRPDTYSSSESMDFTRGQRCKWWMAHSSRGSSSRFPRRCTVGLWRRLTVAFMRR